MELTELKKQYEKLAKKHSLPPFEELNYNFEIEKIDMESDTLLRAVKRVIMEKIINSLSFLEMLLNPINAPRMYLAYLRFISVEDKKIIEKVYGELAELNLIALDNELEYEETSEAKLIKTIFKKWAEIKPEFREVLKNMKKPVSITKKERSYFG